MAMAAALVTEIAHIDLECRQYASRKGISPDFVSFQYI